MCSGRNDILLNNARWVNSILTSMRTALFSGRKDITMELWKSGWNAVKQRIVVDPSSLKGSSGEEIGEEEQ